MDSPSRPVHFRRLGPPTSPVWGNWFRRASRYEVACGDEPREILSLHRLDVLLDGRRHPADFWACVAAADEAFAAGETGAFIEWPSGQRRSLAD